MKSLLIRSRGGRLRTLIAASIDPIDPRHTIENGPACRTSSHGQLVTLLGVQQQAAHERELLVLLRDRATDRGRDRFAGLENRLLALRVVGQLGDRALAALVRRLELRQLGVLPSARPELDPEQVAQAACAVRAGQFPELLAAPGRDEIVGGGQDDCRVRLRQVAVQQRFPGGTPGDVLVRPHLHPAEQHALEVLAKPEHERPVEMGIADKEVTQDLVAHTVSHTSGEHNNVPAIAGVRSGPAAFHREATPASGG